MHDASKWRHYPHGTVRRMPLPFAALERRRKTEILTYRVLVRLYSHNAAANTFTLPPPPVIQKIEIL